MAITVGLEPTTPGLGNLCSVLMSYVTSNGDLDGFRSRCLPRDRRVFSRLNYKALLLFGGSTQAATDIAFHFLATIELCDDISTTTVQIHS